MKPIQRIIRRPETLLKTGLSASTIYHMEKAGGFPMHIMISPKCAGWFESDVDAWMESRRANPAVISSFPDVQLRIAKNKLANEK